MAWQYGLRAAIQAEFRSVQKRARGIYERASDEAEPDAEADLTDEARRNRRRRIVPQRGVAKE